MSGPGTLPLLSVSVSGSGTLSLSLSGPGALYVGARPSPALFVSGCVGAAALSLSVSGPALCVGPGIGTAERGGWGGGWGGLGGVGGGLGGGWGGIWNFLKPRFHPWVGGVGESWGE